MKRFILALLAVFISCVPMGVTPVFHYTNVPVAATVKELPVYISKEFGAEDQLHIDDALNAWNYALNGTIKLVVKERDFDMGISEIRDVFRGPNGGFFIIPVNSQNCPFLPEQATPDRISLAWADLSSRHAVYLVRDRMGTQDVFGVLLHEVGHILGAEHTKDISLMYPTYTRDTYACIDKETVEQVAKFNRLDVNQLNYCIYENAR